jgi:hypothetical protein
MGSAHRRTCRRCDQFSAAGVEHGVDLTKAAHFEQLYWDVFTYAMTSLRTDTPEDIAVALKDFSKRLDDIALISGATTATGT